MLKVSFEYEFYKSQQERLEKNKLGVTQGKVEGYLTKLLIQDRREALHPEYDNPVRLKPIRKRNH